MAKTIHSDSKRAQLIARLEELRGELEAPDLTREKFEDVRGKVLEIQKLIDKAI